jgi:hypothetical protein
VAFTSVSGTDPNLTGNFQLLNSSPYHNAGTDGKDIGVWDWPTFNSKTTNVINGVWVPGIGNVTTNTGKLSNGVKIQ